MDDTVPQKRCSACETPKPITEFYAHPTGKFGVMARCKTCYNLINNVRRRGKPRNRKNERRHPSSPQQQHKHRLWRYYKLTPSQHEDMKAAQSGLCAICGQVPKNGNPLQIDHCHKSGKVRGLLCRRCNYLLGVALDDVDILNRAIEYLEKQKPG